MKRCISRGRRGALARRWRSRSAAGAAATRRVRMRGATSARCAGAPPCKLMQSCGWQSASGMASTWRAHAPYYTARMRTCTPLHTHFLQRVGVFSRDERWAVRCGSWSALANRHRRPAISRRRHCVQNVDARRRTAHGSLRALLKTAPAPATSSPRHGGQTWRGHAFFYARRDGTWLQII